MWEMYLNPHVNWLNHSMYASVNCVDNGDDIYNDGDNDDNDDDDEW